nr:MAG TPA: hypothetical protein [Bacteriophage sp.]
MLSYFSKNKRYDVNAPYLYKSSKVLITLI